MLFVLPNIFFIFLLISKNEAVLYEGDPCKIRDQLGVCTNQDQCPQLMQAFKQHQIRNEEIPRCGFTLNKEVVCCPKANTFGLGTRIPTDGVESSAATKYCRELSKLPPGSLEIHILNGIQVKQNEYGFMASIGYKTFGSDEDTIQFHCGGTLISDRFILTAAHCVSDPRNKPNIVMLGSLHLSEAIEDSLMAIKKTHIHSDYHPDSTYNDIALIELEFPVKFEDNIYPLCLHTDLFSPPAGLKAYVAGWGRTENSPQSNRLMKAELSVVPLRICKSELGGIIPTRRLRHGVQDTQICARGDSRDACEGDSGGPLIYENREGVMFVAGITAAGFGCMGNLPGLYTRVASYLDFIENIVWPSKILAK